MNSKDVAMIEEDAIAVMIVLECAVVFNGTRCRRDVLLEEVVMMRAVGA